MRAPGYGVLAVLGTLLLAACGGGSTADPTPDPSPTPSSSSAPASLGLTVSTSASGGSLVVRYRVVNEGDSAVVLNDRIPVDSESASGQAEVDPAKAFVYGDDGVAVVAKRTFAQRSAPDGPDHTVYYQGTVLEPGATATGEAKVPLPLTDAVPSFASDVPGEVPSDAANWRFCVGVTPSVYEPDVLPDGKHALVSNNLAKGPRAQSLLCSGEQDLPAG